MMNVYFEYEANEIEPELYHNCDIWKFTRPNIFGITHFMEKYNEVDNHTDYLFGIINDELFGFEEWISGEGESVPEKRCGGVFVKVLIDVGNLFIHRPK
jgi:hypothetical protein